MHKLSETDSTTTFQFKLTKQMANDVKARTKLLGYPSAGQYLRELIEVDIADGPRPVQSWTTELK